MLKLQVVLLLPQQVAAYVESSSASAPATPKAIDEAYKFLHLALPNQLLSDVCNSVLIRFAKLYPDETVPVIDRLQDGNQLDLDPDYAVADVFQDYSTLLVLLQEPIRKRPGVAKRKAGEENPAESSARPRKNTKRKSSIWTSLTPRQPDAPVELLERGRALTKSGPQENLPRSSSVDLIGSQRTEPRTGPEVASSVASDDEDMDQNQNAISSRLHDFSDPQKAPSPSSATAVSPLLNMSSDRINLAPPRRQGASPSVPVKSRVVSDSGPSKPIGNPPVLQIPASQEDSARSQPRAPGKVSPEDKSKSDSGTGFTPGSSPVKGRPTISQLPAETAEALKAPEEMNGDATPGKSGRKRQRRSAEEKAEADRVARELKEQKAKEREEAKEQRNRERETLKAQKAAEKDAEKQKKVEESKKRMMEMAKTKQQQEEMRKAKLAELLALGKENERLRAEAAQSQESSPQPDPVKTATMTSSNSSEGTSTQVDATSPTLPGVARDLPTQSPTKPLTKRQQRAHDARIAREKAKQDAAMATQEEPRNPPKPAVISKAVAEDAETQKDAAPSQTDARRGQDGRHPYGDIQPTNQHAKGPIKAGVNGISHIRKHFKVDDTSGESDSDSSEALSDSDSELSDSPEPSKRPRVVRAPAKVVAPILAEARAPPVTAKLATVVDRSVEQPSTVVNSSPSSLGEPKGLRLLSSLATKEIPSVKERTHVATPSRKPVVARQETTSEEEQDEDSTDSESDSDKSSGDEETGGIPQSKLADAKRKKKRNSGFSSLMRDAAASRS